MEKTLVAEADDRNGDPAAIPSGISPRMRLAHELARRCCTFDNELLRKLGAEPEPPELLERRGFPRRLTGAEALTYGVVRQATRLWYLDLETGNLERYAGAWLSAEEFARITGKSTSHTHDVLRRLVEYELLDVDHVYKPLAPEEARARGRSATQLRNAYVIGPAGHMPHPTKPRKGLARVLPTGGASPVDAPISRRKTSTPPVSDLSGISVSGDPRYVTTGEARARARELTRRNNRLAHRGVLSVHDVIALARAESPESVEPDHGRFAAEGARSARERQQLSGRGEHDPDQRLVLELERLRAAGWSDDKLAAYAAAKREALAQARQDRDQRDEYDPGDWRATAANERRSEP